MTAPEVPIYCCTASGRMIDPVRPQPDTIGFDDIIQALSRQPRFAGHTRLPWTVADHSAFVVDILERRDATNGHAARPYVYMFGLLHDAHEAYTGDIPQPIKTYLDSDRLIRLQAALDRATRRSLRLREPTACELQAVQEADKTALRLEGALLMPQVGQPTWRALAMEWDGPAWLSWAVDRLPSQALGIRPNPRDAFASRYKRLSMALRAAADEDYSTDAGKDGQ